MNSNKNLAYFFYRWCAYYLPSIKNSHKDFAVRIRSFLVKRYIDYCGDNINIQSRAVIARRVSIGSNSGVGCKCIIQGGVNIGENVMMGPEVYIYTQNHSFERIDIPMNQQGFSNEKRVIIEDDVWIGARVTILPGVTVGKGSILGASSVVTKDVPPYSIVAGNPARIVKWRVEAGE